MNVKFKSSAYSEYLLLQKYVEQGKKGTRPTYEQLLRSIDNAIENIRIKPHYGDLIPRKYIPKSTAKKYGTNKILRVELVGYWRLLYTLIGEEIEIIALILDFMDHKRYDKKLGYGKK